MSSRNARSTAASARAIALALVGAIALAGCDMAVIEIDGPQSNEVSSNTDFADIVGDDGLSILGQYDLAADGVTLIGDVPASHLAAWQRFAELFPPDLRPEVIQFVAIDGGRSQDTLGAMQMSVENDREFYLALDVTDSSSPDEVDLTIIHEFAHLLTLRPSQVVRGSADQDCDTFTLDLECPIEGAYIRDFADMFWPGYLESDLDDELLTPQDEGLDRYDAASDDYVTDYAATDPAEDICEVFAEWVLYDDVWDGDTVLDAKMRFFDDYPAALAIRERVRANL